MVDLLPQLNSIDKSSSLFWLPPITLNVTKTNSAPIQAGRRIYFSHWMLFILCRWVVFCPLFKTFFLHYFSHLISLASLCCLRWVWRFNLIWLVRSVSFFSNVLHERKNEYSWLIDLCEVAMVSLTEWLGRSAMTMIWRYGDLWANATRMHVNNACIWPSLILDCSSLTQIDILFLQTDGFINFV